MPLAHSRGMHRVPGPQVARWPRVRAPAAGSPRRPLPAAPQPKAKSPQGAGHARGGPCGGPRCRSGSPRRAPGTAGRPCAAARSVRRGARAPARRERALRRRTRSPRARARPDCATRACATAGSATWRGHNRRESALPDSCHDTCASGASGVGCGARLFSPFFLPLALLSSSYCASVPSNGAGVQAQAAPPRPPPVCAASRQRGPTASGVRGPRYCCCGSASASASSLGGGACGKAAPAPHGESSPAPKLRSSSSKPAPSKLKSSPQQRGSSSGSAGDGERMRRDDSPRSPPARTAVAAIAAAYRRGPAQRVHRDASRGEEGRGRGRSQRGPARATVVAFPVGALTPPPKRACVRCFLRICSRAAVMSCGAAGQARCVLEGASCRRWNHSTSKVATDVTRGLSSPLTRH